MTVRGKRARVNSVFLVQLRKKVAADFRGAASVGKGVREKSWEHWMAPFSCEKCDAVEIGWKYREECPQGVHRKCRKAGENQWRSVASFSERSRKKF